MKLKKNGESYRTKYEWHLVDWSLPTSIIADLLGVRVQYVTTARKKYAPETSGTVRTRKDK